MTTIKENVTEEEKKKKKAQKIGFLNVNKIDSYNRGGIKRGGIKKI